MWDCLLLYITTMKSSKTNLQLEIRASICFVCVLVSAALGQDLLGCELKSPIASSSYSCDWNKQQQENHCSTFAVLRTNSYYSSLSNLSSYLGINPSLFSEANGLSAGTESLPYNQPVLIPVDCRCNGGFFEAELTRTTVQGESFYSIAQSLEGLTTCKGIKEKNPNFSPWNLGDQQRLLIPLKCACPSSSEIAHRTKLLLSYPVSEGDTLAALAFSFNTTPENIISVNNRSGAGFKAENLVPFSTLLIPAEDKPRLGSVPKAREPTSLPIKNPHKKKSKMRRIRVYIAIGTIAFAVTIAMAAAFLLLQKKRKKQPASCKNGDVEMQQLGLSIRTTSEKKISFEGSNDDSLNGQHIDTTPHKTPVETYSIEELRKATEDFSSTNLIEDSVFHGRLSGKNLAIKRTSRETISKKIEFGLFCDAIHNHPNIIRVLGTSTDDAKDSYLIFEYAENGSLKDWLHGGLAMKSQFIASCYCFLTWNQRLKICLDVATALQYMHHVMNPAYVHRNIKSRNVFLDEEFNAKVGNFGMARCVEDLGISSWNKGYLAPEYVKEGVISPTIDIFAFGVILLEILSGETPGTKANEKGTDEDDYVWLSQKIKFILESENAAEELREWVDKALGENYSFDAAVRLANLARACVEDDASLRPCAGDIVEKLSRLVEHLPEGDGDHHQSDSAAMCEGSCKPLVKAAAIA